VIEKKSRMRRVDALDHLRQIVAIEYQHHHARTHTHGGNGTGTTSGLNGTMGGMHNIDPLTSAPRKNCQADICFEAAEIIE
jgi:hypothetical protein